MDRETQLMLKDHSSVVLLYPPPRAPCLPAPMCILNIFSLLSAPTLSGQTCLAKPMYSAFGSHVCSSSKPTRTGGGRGGVLCTLSFQLPRFIPAAAAARTEDADVLFAT